MGPTARLKQRTEKEENRKKDPKKSEDGGLQTRGTGGCNVKRKAERESDREQTDTERAERPLSVECDFTQGCPPPASDPVTMPGLQALQMEPRLVNWVSPLFWDAHSSCMCSEILQPSTQELGAALGPQKRSTVSNLSHLLHLETSKDTVSAGPEGLSQMRWD